jgi:lysophospholipase L1-like esterase
VGASSARLLLFRALTLVLVLGTTEGMARTYRHFVAPPDVGLGYPPGLYVWDPLCDFRCKPGFRGAFRDRYSEIPIRINSAGYRDDEFAVERTPGRRRIAFLGDSVTFAPGVRAEERFSDLLREAAAARGTQIETENFAINAYNAYHYAQQARSVLPAYQPDAVVLGLCLNDIEPKERSWPRKYVAAPDGSYVGELFDQDAGARMRDWSSLVSIVFELGTRLRNTDTWLLHMRAIMEEWRDPVQRAALARHLAAVKSALAPRPLLVLVLPEAHDVADPTRFGAPRRAALLLVKSLGLEPIDVFEDFRRDADPPSLFLPGDALHLSPRGHARVAALLEDRLLPAIRTAAAG